MKPGGFLEVGGARLEVRWIAPAAPGRPALVFLHEGLGCVALWRDFPDRLAAATGCGALVYSRAGYGASSPVPLPRPLRYMHDEGLETLPRLLDAAGLEDVVLVGHSDGASIAIVHAGAADPGGRVRGLVLEAPHVFCEPLSVASIEKARAAYLGGDLRARLSRFHGENVDCAFWGWNRAWLDPGFLRWNIEEHLPGIRVPALVLQGRDDEYGTLAQVESVRARSGGPVQVLVLDRCGHSPHRDQPEATLAAAGAFVARLGRPPRGRPETNVV
ncbi:MAG TPA: alpha/beta hydrolase [Anaeromyxobacteraceae bacterium]